MEIIFGITHYNRFNLLKICLDFLDNLSFKNSNLIIKINLYDDASNELEFADFIKYNRYRFNRIIRNEENMGSTGNIYNMYIDFLMNETAEFFFNMDCDLVVSESFPSALDKFLKNDTKLISFYNSSSHGRKSLKVINKELVVIKDHIGSAGTLFSRNCLDDIILNVPSRQIAYDWDWSSYLNKNGNSIYSTYRSYFLHIGFSGDNNSIFQLGNGFDRALNFFFDSKEKSKATYVQLKTYLNKSNIIDSELIISKSQFMIKKIILWLKA